MKTGFRLLAISSIALVGALAGCSNTNTSSSSSSSNPTSTSSSSSSQKIGDVNVGLQGNFGASAGFVGVEEGFFKTAGTNVKTQILKGPDIITGLKAGTLDIGFLGNGVSWNYFVPTNTPIKMLTIDNLSNDDRLIARKGSTHAGVSSLTTDSTLAALHDALMGSTLAADTAATPGTFLKSMITKVNEGYAPDKQVWFRDVDASYPATATGGDAYKITVSTVSNASITATMTGSTAPDFCIAFAPISSTLISDTAKFTEAFTTAKNMPEKLTPSTWAVSTSFLSSHADYVQSFMNGLVKSMDFRSKNVAKAATDTANQLRQEASSIVTDVAYWPSATDLKTYFSTATGKGMTFVEQIRTSQLSNTSLADVTPLAAKDVIDTTYLLNACDYVINA